MPRPYVATGGLVAFALGATLAGDLAQVAFAATSVLVLGLPHGASDHLVACRPSGQRRTGRLAAFLCLYLVAVAATLVVWWAAPGPALTSFLLLSAVHFAIDDLPDAPPSVRIAERIARGLAPVTLPAVLHHSDLADLFALLSTPRWGAELAEAAYAIAPFTLVLLAVAVHRRFAESDGKVWELAGLTIVLLAFPPLVGFALYFALVHSRGQTLTRMRQLRLDTPAAYLLAIRPTLLGALALFAALAGLTWVGHAPAVRPLFIGLSALTVPHMLVTPWFETKPLRQTE